MSGPRSPEALRRDALGRVTHPLHPFAKLSLASLALVAGLLLAPAHVLADEEPSEQPAPEQQVSEQQVSEQQVSEQPGADGEAPEEASPSKPSSTKPSSTKAVPEEAPAPASEEKPAEDRPRAPVARRGGSSAGVVPVDPNAPPPPALPARRTDTDPKPNWSQPSRVAERSLAPENLPSPSVRDPRTGRSAQPAPGRRAALPRAPRAEAPRRTARTSHAAPQGMNPPSPRLRDGEIVPPTPAPNAMTPPRRAANRGTGRPTMTGEGSLAPIQKQHNVRLADGTIAMRMRVTFNVAGLRGGNAFLIARFIERDSGTTLKAALPAFRSPSGALEIRTRPTPQTTDRGQFAADLYVPYNSFPQLVGKPSYAVDAQIRLMGDDGRNAPRELAIETSGFRVHSGG